MTFSCKGLPNNIIWHSECKSQSLQSSMNRFYCSDKKSSSQDKTLWQQFKAMFNNYWYILVPIHVFTSFIWYLVFYYMALCGIDLAEILKRLKFNEEYIKAAERHKAAGELAVAYVLFHLFSPLRYALTIGSTAIVKRHLKRRGIIKRRRKEEIMSRIKKTKK